MIIVKVVFPLPIRRYFEYFLPDLMCPIVGGRILVPFRSKDKVGIVISYYEIDDVSSLNFKYVKLLIDSKSLYPETLLNTLIWISKYYHYPIGQLFFFTLPKFLRDGNAIKKNKYIYKYIYKWTITKKGKEIDFSHLKKRKKQFYALLILKKNSILNTELKKYNLSKFILKKLENEKLCEMNLIRQLIFNKKNDCKVKKCFSLNKKIIKNINDILKNNCFSSWLLTKVCLYNQVKFYLGLIDSVLNKGMQILILVPYIKYINVISVFLKKYFNVYIDTIHSQLTENKYFKIWIKTKNGQNSIIIGTKKSIFLPFLNLGLIIILEEHNLNYKIQNIHCRYSSRDISILRAYQENIPIILNSDTPSLKTLHNVLFKKCFYIKINQDDSITKLNYSVIDLKKEKIKFGFSSKLINEINKNFEKKQVLLIFNKFNLFFCVLSCKKCKWIFKCESCYDYFEINQYHNVLFCKFCLIKIKKPFFCYNCESFDLVIKKIELEKIKRKIQFLFPNKSLCFLLNKKKINKNFIDKKTFQFYISNPCIIFATEEIVQNYFFPYVSLISLISIDHYFFDLKFSNLEFFAQFYFNLSKLTINKNKFFKIIMQTSFSNNLRLEELCENGYFNFAKNLLKIRKKYLLPPWSFHIIIYSESLYSKNNFIFLSLLSKILKIKSNKYKCFLWLAGPHFSCVKNNKTLLKLLIQCSSRIYLYRLLCECIEVINFFSVSKKVKWFLEIELN